MESEKMELRLINPNESGFLQHIEWNSEEIRKQVQMMMVCIYRCCIYRGHHESGKGRQSNAQQVQKGYRG